MLVRRLRGVWPLLVFLLLGLCDLLRRALLFIPAKRDLVVPEGSIVYSILAVAQAPD